MSELCDLANCQSYVILCLYTLEQNNMSHQPERTIFGISQPQQRYLYKTKSFQNRCSILMGNLRHPAKIETLSW